MRLVNSKNNSHWYDYKQGTFIPMYELPKKTGNGVKTPTLREAKEIGLLPSVTTFLQILDKPELDNWKQEKAIHAALTLPRKDGESEDDFAVRVVEDMEAESEKAMTFGSDIHAAIEAYLAGEPLLETDPLWPWLKDFAAWAKDDIIDVIASEEIVGNAFRNCCYAGRMDLLCTLKSCPEFTLIDLKTQRIKKNAKGIKTPVFYKEWLLQLCSYSATETVRQLICKKYNWEYPDKRAIVSNLISVVIDSSEPGPVFVKRWENTTEAYQAVRNAYDLWCFMKGYTPTVKQNQPES